MVLSSKQVSSDGTLDWGQNLLLQDGLVTTLLGLPKQEQSSSGSGNDHQQNAQKEEQQAEAPTMNVTRCPRCDSANTKFCYYNNYNRSQPRHFCKTCRRHWTKGGTLRNVPVGGGRKKNTNKYNKKRIVKTSNTGSSPALSTTASTRGGCTGDSQVTSHSGIGLRPNFIKPILRVEQPGDHQHNYFVNNKHISVGSSYNNNSSSKISSGGLAGLDATTTSPSDHVDPQMPSFPLLTAHMNSYSSSNNENFDDSPRPSDLHHESDPALIEFAEDQFNNALYSLSSSTATPISMPPSSVHFNNHNFLDPGFWNWDDDLPTSSVSPDLNYFPYLDDPRLGV